MGTYITYNELIKRYAIFEKAYENPTEVEDDMIASAEAMLNGMLGKCMSIPLPVVTQVKDMVKDLCYYKHLTTKDPDLAAKIRDAVAERIKGICAGDEALLDANGNIIDLSGAGQTVWSSTEGYIPVFGMLDASDPASHVDSSQLYDEETERQ